VRVFTYNQQGQAWDEEGLGLGIANNVEALTAGDLDGDGKAEIVAGLEGVTNETRVRMFRYNNGWSEEAISPPSYQPDVQYVSVSDLYGNGERSVIVLAAFPPLGAGSMELRAFRKRSGIWSSELIASNVGGFSRAERFVAANLDSDPELEIVIGMWSGGGYSAGGLYMLDYDGTTWQSVPMNTTLGVIDGIGVGKYSSQSVSDLLIGTWRQVLLYSRTQGAWTPQIVIPSIAAFMTWDADFGTLRELGNVGLVALDNRLIMLRRNSDGSSTPTLIKAMPSRIDSVQVGDVDGLSNPCEVSDSALLTVQSAPHRAVAIQRPDDIP
jgi:hypothetical protein